MNALQAYGLSKKYTYDTTKGMGAIKGNPCTILSTETVDTGIKITFKWYSNNEDSTGQTTAIVVPKGKDGSDGVSVTDVTVNDEGHIIVTLSDSTTVDAGALTPKLTSPLTSTVAIGSIGAGKTYATGTNLEQIIRDILVKKTAPSVTLAISPSVELYDKTKDTLSSITLKGTVVKGTNALSKIVFYADSTLINTQEITSAGAYSYIHTFDTATNTDFTLKSSVYDTESMTTSSSKTVKFIYPSYCGTIANADTVDEASVKALTYLLKDTKTYTASFSYNAYGRCIYAYPASYGELTNITDKDLSMNIITSFTKLTMTINGVSYYVYKQIDSSEIAEGKTLVIS